MTKDIITHDNPLLREISEPVTDFDETLVELVSDMIEATVVHSGIGLSAVQIGMTKRVILVQNENRFLIMVNPVFVRKLSRETVMREGCLSIPGLHRNVSRPAKCELRYQLLNGEEQTGNFSGLTARIIQHEMDHLDGILISDKPHL